MRKKLLLEALGTFLLVAALCGTMIAGARLAGGAVGITGIALAAGVTLACLYYLVAPQSGGHLNPAVSLGAWIAKRITGRQMAWYMVAQLGGAALAAFAFFIILSFQPGFQPLNFAANGYGAHSPGNYPAPAVFGAEFIQTGFFVLIFLRLTSANIPHHIAAIGIGLAYGASHLATYAISGTSLNPARSTASALFAEGWAIDQLWLFWLAPLAGAAVAGLLFAALLAGNTD